MIEYRTIARWVIGVIVAALFCVATIIILTSGDREYVLLIVGALIGAFTTVVGFYFGSSEKEHN